MYGDEFAKIREAADNYQRASITIQQLQDKRQKLAERQKDGSRMKIAFTGITTEIEVPESISKKLYEWLDEQLRIGQSELAQYQMQLTCPAGTNDR